MISHSKPIIVIAGPTASGKSSLAIKLAKKINGVIINADSKQVYKELSIGTAKPNQEEMQGIPHYLYGHISIKEDYNIYKYQKDFKKVLNEIDKNKIPVLVGGSGLYIDSVIFNYELKPPPENDDTLRRREELNKMKLKELQNLIKEMDPNLLDELNESDKKNPVRLIRILEKGRSRVKNQPLKHTYFVIDISKEKLNERIMQRTEQMFNKGLLEENIKIKEKYPNKYTELNTIGYQEFEDYFQKQISLETVKKKIIQNTQNYAKRQRTWFRKHRHAIWTNDYNLILEESLKLIKT